MDGVGKVKTREYLMGGKNREKERASEKRVLFVVCGRDKVATQLTVV